MASSSMKTSFIIIFACSLLLQGTLGEIICEELPTSACAFSIASSGKRCLLENSPAKEDGNEVEYQCKTSEVVVAMMAEHIETDQCVNDCGVDRNSVGISSDSLLEPEFTRKLCSKSCQHNCPNIVDLYFNMAAGEGVYLPELCEKQRNSPHRSMIELSSSGAVAEVAAFSPMSENLAAASSPAASPAA